MSILKSISFSGVNFDRLQANPTSMGIESFNSMNNIQCPNEMREFIAPTAQYLFNYVVSKATTNVFRAVHYNMLISDNYSNPELIIMTTFALNMAYLKLKNGVFNDVKQALSTCCTWIADRRVNFIIISEPRLANLAAANIQDVRNTATEYVNEAEEVNHLLANTFTSGPVSASFGQNNQNRGFGDNNSSLSGFGNTGGGNNNAGFNFGGTTSQMSSGFSSNNQTMTGFGGNIQTRASGINSVITRTNQDGVNIQKSSRFEGDIQGLPTTVRERTYNAPQEVQEVKNVQPSKPVETIKARSAYFNEDGSPNMSVLPETTQAWHTNEYQRYAIAYDPRYYSITNKLLPAKTSDKVFVVSSLMKVDSMDRSAHALTSSELFLSQILPAKVGYTAVNNREEFKEASLVKTTDFLKEVRDVISENDYVKRLDEFRSKGHFVLSEPVSSVQEAITYARLAAMVNIPDELGSYQFEFKLVKELPICSTDIAEVTKLMNYKTFQSLASKIRGTIEDAHAPQSLRTVMVQINAYLAKKFLEYIRFYLCIDDYVASDSFIDDTMAMIDDIGEKIGQSYKEIILASQVRFIETNLSFGDVLQNKVTDVNSNLMHDDKVDNFSNVALLPIMIPCLLTCTDFLNSEYNLKTPTGIGAMFTATTTTDGLFELVLESVKKPYSAGLQTNIKRFFIATLDDALYETNIGLPKDAAPLMIMKLD